MFVMLLQFNQIQTHKSIHTSYSKTYHIYYRESDYCKSITFCDIFFLVPLVVLALFQLIKSSTLLNVHFKRYE